jgi:hypothetical protein
MRIQRNAVFTTRHSNTTHIQMDLIMLSSIIVFDPSGKTGATHAKTAKTRCQGIPL